MLQGYTQFVIEASRRQNYYSREYFQRTPRVGVVPGDIVHCPSPDRYHRLEGHEKGRLRAGIEGHGEFFCVSHSPCLFSCLMV